MAKKRKVSIGEYISGRVLANENFIRRLPVVGYVALLMLYYMSNTFGIQAKYEQMDELNDQIKALEISSTTTAERRMDCSRRSEVEKQLARFGIKLINDDQQPEIIEGGS